MSLLCTLQMPPLPTLRSPRPWAWEPPALAPSTATPAPASEHLKAPQHLHPPSRRGWTWGRHVWSGGGPGLWSKWHRRRQHGSGGRGAGGGASGAAPPEHTVQAEARAEHLPSPWGPAGRKPDVLPGGGGSLGAGRARLGAQQQHVGRRLGLQLQPGQLQLVQWQHRGAPEVQESAPLASAPGPSPRYQRTAWTCSMRTAPKPLTLSSPSWARTRLAPRPGEANWWSPCDICLIKPWRRRGLQWL